MENPSERNPSASAAGPQLCLGGCGFYGSHATEGLCSKCYKESATKGNNGTGASSSSADNLVHLNTVKPIDIQESKMVETSSSPVLVDQVKSTVEASTSVSVNNNPLTASRSESSSLAAKITVKEDSVGGAESDVATTSTGSSGNNGSSPQSTAPPLVKKNRCAECRKKVGLTGFECRCGGMYCGMHRYSDTHQCSFDYKKLGEDEIRKANPLVQAAKIDKI